VVAMVCSKCLDKLVVLMLGIYGIGIKFGRHDTLVYLALKAMPEVLDLMCGD